MKVDYPKNSPYGATPQASWFIGRYVHRRIPANAGDRTIVLEARHHLRPDLLAQEKYGSPAYWWVFCVRNTRILRDPIWDFTAGTEIIVPSSDHVKKIVG